MPTFKDLFLQTDWQAAILVATRQTLPANINPDYRDKLANASSHQSLSDGLRDQVSAFLRCVAHVAICRVL